MRRLKNEVDQSLFLKIGGTGKILGGIPHLRHHRDDGPNTDGAVKSAKTLNGLIIRGMSLTMNLVQKLQ